MPRQVLIVFTVFLTISSVMSAEYELKSSDAHALGSAHTAVAPTTTGQESQAFDALLNSTASELTDTTISQNAQGDCQPLSQRFRLKLNSSASTHVVETAVQYFLSTERALAF